MANDILDKRPWTAKSVAVGLLVPIVLLACWDLLVRSGVLPRTLIASPIDVAKNLISLTLNGALFIHAAVSLKRLLAGFLIGTTAGVATGIVVGYWKLGRRLLELTVLVLLPIPPIAWIPLLIILLGVGEGSKIALISLGSFFTLFLNTVHGIRNADVKLLEVAFVLDKGPRAILGRVLLPAALPSIMAGARVAMALSWTLLICAEVIASARGLGWLIWDARNFSRPADMIAGMVAVGVLGKLTDAALVLLERYWTRYRVAFQGH